MRVRPQHIVAAATVGSLPEGFVRARDIDSRAADDEIVARVAVAKIDARTRVDAVIPTTTTDHIATGRADENVISAAAIDVGFSIRRRFSESRRRR